MNYIYLFLTFLFVLVGVFGNTWNSKAKGLKKITLVGWSVIIISFVTLSLSSWDIYRNQIQQAKTNSYIKDELSSSLYFMTYPFILSLKAIELHNKVGYERAINSDIPFPLFPKLCASDLEKLTEESYISFLKSIKFEQNDIMVIFIKLGFDSLEKILNRHNTLLNTEHQILIGKILNNGFILDILHKIEIANNNKVDPSITNSYILDNEHVDQFKEFLRISNSLLLTIGDKVDENNDCTK